jgi:hypothetical protein
LSWTSSLGAVTYNIKRAPAWAGPYTNLANRAETTFADTNVANGTPYFYSVSAVNPIGESANSSPVSAVLPLPSLRVVPTNNVLALSWPITASIFSLWNATNLTPTSVWTAVSSPTTNVNDQVATAVTPAGDTRFYRLQSH